MSHPLLALGAAYHRGEHRGITSVCSAHPLVIEAALRLARQQQRPVLIEATCNQVNQDGGYTGMTPRDFRAFVEAVAARVGIDPQQIILGGDHLGPNPWRHLPAEAALAKAERLVAAYAAAGFSKLHLDCSMGCAGEPVALDDATTATRAAQLAAVAEQHWRGQPPVYVIGTEVPVPGGADHALDHLAPTTAEAAAETYRVHQAAFAARGLEAAFARVIALVVQPGVEFGHSEVVAFDPVQAQALSAQLRALPGMLFEAHSTDYQSPAALRALVVGGFAILKVGPALTFALREALYALDAIADVLDGRVPQGSLMARMDAVMRAAPGNWQKYYQGSASEQFRLRHFSYSDRIRYYWPEPEAAAAVEALLARLAGRAIPEPLRAQYLPQLTGSDAHGLLLAAVQRLLNLYQRACTP